MSRRWCLGSFELRPESRQLLATGRPLSIGARASDVLLTLVEQQGRVVGKQELLDRVWRGLVVEENNLTVQVAALRKLLGRDAVVTVAAHG